MKQVKYVEKSSLPRCTTYLTYPTYHVITLSAEVALQHSFKCIGDD